MSRLEDVENVTNEITEALVNLTEAIQKAANTASDVAEIWRIQADVSESVGVVMDQLTSVADHIASDGGRLHALVIPELLSTRLREARETAGWTQAQLASEMQALGFDWTRNTVADAELGRRSISVEDLVCLAVVFSVPVTSFLTLQEDEGIDFGSTYLRRDDLLGLVVGTDGTGGSGGDGQWNLPQVLAAGRRRLQRDESST